MEIHQATLHNLTNIKIFTDFWLAGRGKAKGVANAVNDCFISPSQHKKYITKYKTYILTIDGYLAGWAVIQTNGALIHFLISGYCRHQGLGTILMKFLDPRTVHSKLDQSSGNPGPFYEKLGYRKIGTVQSKSRLDIDKIRPDRKKNIDIYQKGL